MKPCMKPDLHLEPGSVPTVDPKARRAKVHTQRLAERAHATMAKFIDEQKKIQYVASYDYVRRVILRAVAGRVGGHID